MSLARYIVCALSILALAGCAGDPLREDVIAQARPDGRIAFDVIKIDDRVLETVLAEPPPKFQERFKKSQPPPELKIAVGDRVSVVIWEAASDGLFGNSLTELTFPAGSAAQLLTGQVPGLFGIRSRPQDLTASPETLRQLFPTETAAAGATGLAPSGLLATSPLAAEQVPATSALGAATGGDPAAAASGAGLAAGLGTGVAAPTADAVTPARTRPVVPDTAPTRSQEAHHADNIGERRLGELLERAEQSGRPGTRIPDQPVGPDGAVSIPYAGRVAVAGRTASEAEHAIEAKLAGKALEPQVIVIIKASAANSVSVAGEVVGGKRVPLSPGGDRLLQVIAAAGGAKAPPHDTFVQLSRDGITASLPLARLISDPAEDIYAEPGDVLTLVRRPQTLSVFGAVGKNTAFTFNSDRLSLAEALAKAGGLLDERADPRAVFLFRYEPVRLVEALGQPVASSAPPGVSPIVYRLDLNEAESYLQAKRFPVRDKDIIFVANAELVPVYRFFVALSKVAGPVETGLIACFYSKSC